MRDAPVRAISGNKMILDWRTIRGRSFPLRAHTRFRLTENIGIYSSHGRINRFARVYKRAISFSMEKFIAMILVCSHSNALTRRRCATSLCMCLLYFIDFSTLIVRRNFNCFARKDIFSKLQNKWQKSVATIEIG